MPRGKLVSKSEVQRPAAPKAKRGRPVGSTSAAKTARKQSIAKVSRTATPVTKTKTAERPHQPAISITVQIPSLRRTKDAGSSKTAQPIKKSENRPRRWIALTAGVAVVAGVAGAIVLLPSKHLVFKPGSAVEAAARTAPDYQPLMLADQKPTTESFDGKRDMVSFTTTFSGVRVTVSEQALPKNFTADPAALLRAADSLNAKKRVDTARGIVFVATNDTAGDQMGIFADKQVLGFIHTDHQMDDTFWKSFVEQLKATDWQGADKTASS